jgi:dTDP-4-amino-4,6-dideoxygalactose transaminase
MRERGIGTQVHYIPLPMQPYYRDRGWDPAAFPGALRYYERTLSLPLFPAMHEHDVDRVVDALRAVLGSGPV